MARVALVPGGTCGIGAAISEALARVRYRVAATYAGNVLAANAFHAPAPCCSSRRRRRASLPGRRYRSMAANI